MMSEAAIFTKVWQKPAYFIAFGFGTGLMPFAPGTWGTLIGVVLYTLIAPLPQAFYFLLLLIFFGLGVYVSTHISQELGIDDYKGIVWDEVVGFCVTMTMVPCHSIWLIIGFILFRLFDVCKPWPISFIDQHIKSGLGIMLDDVLAGVCASLILHSLIWISSL